MIFPPWTDEEKAVLEVNINTMSYRDLSKLLPGRTVDAIKRRADLLGVKREGNRFPKRSLNESFFAELTPKSCYWAGFLAADGCVVTEPRQEVRFGLHYKDRDVLVRFCKDVGYDGPISQRGDICHVTICAANQWIHDLARYFNIGPRKTFTLKPPFLHGQDALAYSIGYIDGDGCWHREKSSRLHLIVVGTNSILRWFITVWEAYDIELGKGRLSFARNCWRLHISSRFAEGLATFLRSVPVTERLDRKWNIAYRRGGAK